MLFKRTYRKRRAHERHRCYCLIKFKAADKPETSEKVVASLRNISEGGILFVSKKPLPVGARLMLEINLPTAGSPVVTEGIIAHSERSKGGRRHTTGVQFLNMRDSDKKRIADAIASLR